MYKYLICKTHVFYDEQNNLLGPRVCDVCESTFPVSNDYEWIDYPEYIDVYTGAWYWTDKPNQYIPPEPVVAPEDQPNAEGTQTL